MRGIRGAVITVVAVVAGAGLTGMYVAARYEARIGQVVRETIAQRETLYDLLRDPATRIIELRGPGRAQASGRVVWHETKGGLLLVSGLPPAPEGHTYVAWTTTAGGSRSAARLHVDVRGRAAQRLDATGGAVEEFAVSLEPRAGAAAPAEPVVLTSK
jgi:hypothetical protein